METQILWPAWLIAGALTLLWLWLTLRAGRRLRALADTPTSKAKGVFIGQVELAGTAELDPPRRSFLAEQPCVWFHFTIEEEWARWETETYTDKEGRTRTRRVRKSGWTTLAAEGESPAFFVADETGAVRVQPEGADLEPLTVFSQNVGRGDALYYGKGPGGGIADSTGRRRFTERALPLHVPLFVAGRARERTDAVAPEIAADPAQEFFLITCRDESQIQRGYRWKFWSFGVLLVVCLPVAALVQAHGTARPVNLPLVFGLAAGLAAVWLTGWLWMTFNSLVQLRHRTAQAWSLVEVQLKRRADLIPRLVEVLVGLRDHERSVQAEIAALRAQGIATAPWQPGPDVAAARGVLQVVAERYPELKTSAAFLGLQRELSDSETRIALARDYFNAIATHLNTRLEIVPDRWVAALANSKPQPLLAAESFEREAVAVKLGA